MRIKLLIVLLSYSLLLFSTTTNSSSRKRFILKLSDNISNDEIKEVQVYLKAMNAKNAKTSIYSRVGDVMYVTDQSRGILNQLRSLDQVEYFEEDKTIPLDEIPGDPNVVDQWHHKNIHTFSAWDITKGLNVIVGVCDTGVDKEHLDINPNLIIPGYNVVDDSFDMTPVHPHGTSVSALIAAVANNGMGGVGISPKVKVLPIKVSNESDGRAYYSDLAECIMYAVDRGAKVVNLSYGGADTEVINAAGKYARNNGALLVAAAGNSGMDISKWKDWESFVMVGATDSRNEIAYFSNYGTPIDLVAPGLSVVTADMTTEDDKVPYKSTSGTSFSAPMVAATAALIYSVDPNFSNEDVQQILYQSSDSSIGGEYEFGAGLLNVSKAVDLAVEKSKSND
jgi:thermitase